MINLLYNFAFKLCERHGGNRIECKFEEKSIIKYSIDVFINIGTIFNIVPIFNEGLQ